MSDDIKRSMNVYYDRRAPEYDDWYERRGNYHNRESDDQWFRELAELDEKAQSWGLGRVLEIACGTGRWTSHLAANLRVTSVVAVDGSPSMLKQAKHKVTDGANKVEWMQADAYSLPFAEGEFDALFAGFFLSHVPADQALALLRSYTKLLRPGGVARIYDSLLPVGSEAVQIQRRVLNDGSAHDVLKVYYTPDTLRDLLAPIDPEVSTWCTGRFFVAADWTRQSE